MEIPAAGLPIAREARCPPGGTACLFSLPSWSRSKMCPKVSKVAVASSASLTRTRTSLGSFRPSPPRIMSSANCSSLSPMLVSGEVDITPSEMRVSPYPRGSLDMMVTLAPAFAASTAAITPAPPEPITSTSDLLTCISLAPFTLKKIRRPMAREDVEIAADQGVARRLCEMRGSQFPPISRASAMPDPPGRFDASPPGSRPDRGPAGGRHPL